MKNNRTPPRAIVIPVTYARCGTRAEPDEPFHSSPPPPEFPSLPDEDPPPPLPVPISSISSATVLPGINTPAPLPQPCSFLRRQILRDEILAVSRYAEFIWTTIDAGIMAAKIIDGRRRVGDPFQRSGVPRIFACNCAVLQAPEKVEEENELRGRGDERSVGHEHVNGLKR